jgi:hypothetical protein
VNPHRDSLQTGENVPEKVLGSIPSSTCTYQGTTCRGARKRRRIPVQTRESTIGFLRNMSLARAVHRTSESDSWTIKALPVLMLVILFPMIATEGAL